MLKETNLSPHQFRQHILLVFLAPFGAAVFGLLAIYDAFFLDQIIVAAIPAILSLTFLFAWSFYKIKNDLCLPTSLIILVSTLVLIAFILNNQNESFGLVWAILYPPLIIMTLGHKKGIKLASGLYIVLVIILFNGMGQWQNGAWDMTGLIRFSLSYIVMAYMSYVLAVGNKLSYGELKKAHQENIKENEKVKKLATIDSVTGVFNRGYLKKNIEKLPLEELVNQKTNMVFFIVQINWFQNYVDFYGYEKGDELLKKISQIIQQQMLAVNGDVFRVTGSQFSGLVLSKDITKTLCLINEIQERVQQAGFKNAIDCSETVNVSIGITIFSDFANLDFNYIYQKTDEALYLTFEKSGHQAMIVDLRKA